MPKGRAVPPPPADPYREAREAIAVVVYKNWDTFARGAYTGFTQQGRGAMVFSSSDQLNAWFVQQRIMPTGGIATSYGPLSEVYAILRDVFGPQSRHVAEAKTLEAAIAGYDPARQVVAVGVAHEGPRGVYLVVIVDAPSDDQTPEALYREGGAAHFSVPTA